MAALKFLVVDDAAFIRDMLKKNLRNHFPGCEILDAVSAKKAQVLLKTNRVDLILCDWEMPEMTGEEFLRWVRSQPAYASLPFIMVTSRGERDFIIKAVQAGVSDYLGKPFTPEGLVSKVTKALAKVGKSANTRLPEATSHSLDILTGAAAAATATTNSTPPPTVMNDSVSILTASSVAPSKAAFDAKVSSQSPANKPSLKARGQALLTFAGFNTQCVISAITLQSLTGAIKREDRVPNIFETVVISIVQNDGEDVARLNGYIHSLQAGENHIDAGVLKLVIRFVDDDPQKLEQLSRYIAKLS